MGDCAKAFVLTVSVLGTTWLWFSFLWIWLDSAEYHKRRRKNAHISIAPHFPDADPTNRSVSRVSEEDREVAEQSANVRNLRDQCKAAGVPFWSCGVEDLPEGVVRP